MSALVLSYILKDNQVALQQNKTIGLLILGLAAFLGMHMATPEKAVAGCTDPAEPAVDWYRCYMDARSFEGANLQGARLREARFNRANLSKANLKLIDGRRAKFLNAELNETTLEQALLQEADFTNANLQSANLKESDLSRARFFRSNLKEVDFTGAELRGADFLKADLSGAIWIDGVRICAPGSIGQCN